MSTVEKPRLTPEEYLAIERKAEFKSEFYGGEMFAMAGASRRHNLIGLNIAGSLLRQLAGRPCETYHTDMRVRVTATGLNTYPDVTVVCGKREFLDTHEDTLLNPTVLFEVLSPSTESYDRGRKFDHYCQIESLQEYVIVAQAKPYVLRFTRDAEGEWRVRMSSELTDSVELGSIDCKLALAEIYNRVEFAADDGDDRELKPDRVSE
jgi:Uma2 family endonuclease